ncbi:hypothetical protein DY000_02005940 [Brassica cretica]|uniref:Uncharacterized protein n=1 Tax=Brassica cretica TaxID=69181 RepID=A0ABQ7BSZ3_BRACR|nr:hypothetical protein DY000_02005940 [Brassica cretica]
MTLFYTDLSKPTAHLTHNQICSRQNTQDLRENDCRNPSNPKSRPISVNPPHTARQNSRQPSSPPVSDSRSFFDLQSTKHLTAGLGFVPSREDLGLLFCGFLQKLSS